MSCGGRVLEQRDRLLDLVAIPERAVLFFERHEAALGVEPGVAARVLEQQQRQQPLRLRLARHELDEQSRQANRLGAEVVADEGVS